MTTQEVVTLMGAQLYNPASGMFYRWTTTMFNDRSVATRLQYLSFTDTWQFSGEDDQHRYAEESLVPIPGAKQHDPVAEEVRLRAFRDKLDKDLETEDWWNSEGRGDCPKWHRLTDAERNELIQTRTR
jgi:hypothetical protein